MPCSCCQEPVAEPAVEPTPGPTAEPVSTAPRLSEPDQVTIGYAGDADDQDDAANDSCKRSDTQTTAIEARSVGYCNTAVACEQVQAAGTCFNDDEWSGFPREEEKQVRGDNKDNDNINTNTDTNHDNINSDEQGSGALTAECLDAEFVKTHMPITCSKTCTPAGGCGAQQDAEVATLSKKNEQLITPIETCNKGCSETALQGGDSNIDDSDVPDCCRGKVAPCCDDACLVRLAIRECDAESAASAAATVDKTAAGETDDACCQPPTLEATNPGACDRHRRVVKERYGATLEALGCICRALLALGQESCCETRKRSLDKVKFPKKSLDRPAGCVPGRYASGTSSKPSSVASRTSRKSRTSSCCPKQLPRRQRFPPRDVESQASGREHVALSISGMTCTGCETKLSRTLAALAGIENLKTSLVLSRAEFDVDLRVVTVNGVIKHLERTTEFKCERITSRGSSVEIIVPGDPLNFVNGTWPQGVIDVSIIDKEVVRVTFDPTLVGARDLLEKHWGTSTKLAPIRGDPSLEAGSKHVRHVGYTTLLSAALTIPVLVMAWAPIPDREIAYSSASLALATVVQVFVAGPFYPQALKALVFSRVVEMDLLIVLSTTTAFIFSVVSYGYLVAGKPLSTGQFFETSTLLVTLIMVGRYVAALARQKAVESISFQSLQTPTALLVDSGCSSGVREMDARLLQYGDVFKVLPDTTVPTDGVVLSGSSEVDESMLTGESLPIEKRIDSSLMAGTINHSGTMLARVTRLPGENTISAIAAMVDEAKLSKPKMQDLADRVASYFVPVVLTLTIVTFVIWVTVGVTVRSKEAGDAAVDALTYAITVLIVSCPCAIGLAVPMVVVIASELAHTATHVVFDKTGTLTQGRLTVIETPSLSVDKDNTLSSSSSSSLLGLIENSRHPVSLAVADHLKSRGVVALSVPNVKSLTGRGLEAELTSQTLRAGNARWLNLSSHPLVKSLLAQAYTVFCFTIDDELAAVFGLEDSLRDDAAHVTAAMQRRNISIHLVSGDDDGAVQAVATRLGIPPHNVRSRSSPAEKQAYIKALLASPPGKDSKDNKNKPIIIFCGDGTNDAAALAQATIGVHINQASSSHIAKSAADVVLARPNLSGLITMMDLSRQSVRRIRFNFAWSFLYNTFAVLLAGGAFVRARIPPQFGGLGELVSVLPVVAAAVLLRWTKI
ncbi:P-type cation-transporting ATPase [Cladobotryum mycophilum]|uniref:P-type cation-transporting ATPase n=1 Tax=Cladobotryum mycophilum TaxID=491253 RepID=A0ABR0T4K0_9HYPO